MGRTRRRRCCRRSTSSACRCCSSCSAWHAGASVRRGARAPASEEGAMEKRTLYALIAVIALGGVAFAVLRAPEKGQRQGPAPRPLPAVKASDVAKLELTNDKNEKTVLEKSGAEWRVKEPGDWKADQQGVKQVLDGLE